MHMTAFGVSMQVQWLELQYNEWYVPMRFLYLVHCRERRVVLRNEVLRLIANLILLFTIVSKLFLVLLFRLCKHSPPL